MTSKAEIRVKPKKKDCWQPSEVIKKGSLSRAMEGA